MRIKTCECHYYGSIYDHLCKKYDMDEFMGRGGTAVFYRDPLWDMYLEQTEFLLDNEYIRATRDYILEMRELTKEFYENVMKVV